MIISITLVSETKEEIISKTNDVILLYLKTHSEVKTKTYLDNANNKWYSYIEARD